MARIFDRVQGTAQSTDGSTVNVISYELPENCTATFQFDVIGSSTAGSVAYRSFCGCQRSTGDAALIGSGPAGYGGLDEGLAGGGTPAAVTPAVSGSNLLITGRGVAGITISWAGELAITLTVP